MRKKISSCLDNITLIGPIDNLSPNPTLCGTVGLVKQKPLPWAWREFKNNMVMPAEVIKIEVNCEMDK